MTIQSTCGREGNAKVGDSAIGKRQTGTETQRGSTRAAGTETSKSSPEMRREEHQSGEGGVSFHPSHLESSGAQGRWNLRGGSVHCGGRGAGFPPGTTAEEPEERRGGGKWKAQPRLPCVERDDTRSLLHWSPAEQHAGADRFAGRLLREYRPGRRHAQRERERDRPRREEGRKKGTVTGRQARTDTSNHGQERGKGPGMAPGPASHSQ